MDRTNHLVREADGDADQLKKRIAELEARLQEEKMNAIGRLSAGVAHDFNNFLTPILAYANLVREDLPADHPMREFVGEILVAGEKAHVLTRTLHGFRMGNVANPASIDLNQVVKSVVDATPAAEGHAVATSLDPSAGLVLAENGQIDTLLQELIRNARTAMPAGGTTTVSTRPASSRETEGREGAFVVLSVRDEGSGMTADVRRNLFEPYFTTKPKGQGKGLGLAGVYAAVKRVGGFIRCSSELGAGTDMLVFLRRAA